MPHHVLTEEKLDFCIEQATRTLKDSEYIPLTSSTTPDGKVKLKFKTKGRLYTFVAESRDAARLEGKYAKVRKE